MDVSKLCDLMGIDTWTLQGQLDPATFDKLLGILGELALKINETHEGLLAERAELLKHQRRAPKLSFEDVFGATQPVQQKPVVIIKKAKRRREPRGPSAFEMQLLERIIKTEAAQGELLQRISRLEEMIGDVKTMLSKLCDERERTLVEENKSLHQELQSLSASQREKPKDRLDVFNSLLEQYRQAKRV